MSEFISLVVDIVHLRQAGLGRVVIEDRLMQDRKLPRQLVRRLVVQVERELQIAKRKMELPLAISAEGLMGDCVEISKATSTERRN